MFKEYRMRVRDFIILCYNPEYKRMTETTVDLKKVVHTSSCFVTL